MTKKPYIFSNQTCSDLVVRALNSRKLCYAPYSGFKVGAALLCANGNIYDGCNIENSSYGATMCAERVAFFNAVAHGEKQFVAIAIVGGKEDCPTDFTFPCGICLQTMSELTCPPKFVVICAKSVENYKILSLAELLPNAFNLKK